MALLVSLVATILGGGGNTSVNFSIPGRSGSRYLTEDFDLAALIAVMFIVIIMSVIIFIVLCPDTDLSEQRGAGGTVLLLY